MHLINVARKNTSILQKSVNSDFIPRVIEAIVEHKPDKKWLRPKKLRSIAGIACRVIL